jgi:small-conductance mechanosensitive channel
VLSFSRPYRPGDWISVEGGTDGRVIEMNWRATYVLTARRDLAIIPNSTIAKSKIVNVSSPSGIHGTTITIQLDSKTPPSIASEILEYAIINCKLIVATPAPSINVKTLNASYTEFDITFSVEELASSATAQNELFGLMYRHLAAAGIDLATPEPQPVIPTADKTSERTNTGPIKLVDLVDIFATLTTDERAAIAAKLQTRSYDKSETLFLNRVSCCNRCSSSATASSR